MTDRDVITVEEAAELYPMSRKALWEGQRKGSVPGFKIGRRTFFRRSELDAWFSAYREQKEAPTPQPENRPKRTINPNFFRGA